MKKVVRIGSRESVLAVKQAEIVMEAVCISNPEIAFELKTFKTTGDIQLDKSLDKIGGKGLFIKELEQALINGAIDLAVHSYKDMPHEETELPVVALSEREAPFDALVLPEGAKEPDWAGPVGSSSARRAIQLKSLYRGVLTEPVRGNVLTRLKKLDSGGFSALVLAQAGLGRLGLEHRIHKVFTPAEMLPAGSQGILAVQGRKGEDYSYLGAFHSLKSEIASRAERRFLKALNSNCSAPVAVYCQINGRELLLSGMYVDILGNMEKGAVSGVLEEAERLGEKLAAELTRRCGG